MRKQSKYMFQIGETIFNPKIVSTGSDIDFYGSRELNWSPGRPEDTQGEPSKGHLNFSD